MMKRFYLYRDVDETGISGVGIVAEGIQFMSGRCVIEWRTEFRSIGIYESVEDLIAIHGHNGKTRVVWLKEDSNIIFTSIH